MSSESNNQVEASNSSSLHELLQIKIVEAKKEKMVLSMPVGPRVHQPYGLLHGGISVALAESAASMGAYLNIDAMTQRAVGMEINANHLRPKTKGMIYATALPLHLGRSTHVWQVTITDEDGKKICISRCTMAILPA